MEIKWIPIDQIKPYEKNPRINENAVEQVAESIRQYGWQQPLVLDKDKVIVVGHTRYKAAISMGMETVPCIIADNLTKAQAKAYRIADNKTSDFSLWNNALLLDELSDLDDLFTGFDIEPFAETAEILDESDNSIIMDADFETMYEVVFKSRDEKKIIRIKEMWDEICDNTEE